MILNAEKIIAEKIILDSVDGNYDATSYEVCIGNIILNQEKEVIMLDEYKLLPGGIVTVISKETVKLPRNITGYAMVKTSLCNEGILPLNIGIIDPGYEGPISAMLLNFSKKEFLLNKNKDFLRLVFHECYESDKYDPKQRLYTEYLEEKKNKAINFAPQFLNLDLYIKEAAQKFNEEFKNTLWKVIPILAGGIAFIALLITTFSFLVTLGVNYGNRHYWNREDLKSDIIKEVNSTHDSRLEEKIKELEEKINKLTTTQTSPTP